MKLLREIEDEARKSRKLRWTDERIAQFEKLKQTFNDLQSLYFLVEGGTVKVSQMPQIMKSGVMSAG